MLWWSPAANLAKRGRELKKKVGDEETLQQTDFGNSLIIQFYLSTTIFCGTLNSGI